MLSIVAVMLLPSSGRCGTFVIGDLFVHVLFPGGAGAGEGDGPRAVPAAWSAVIRYWWPDGWVYPVEGLVARASRRIYPWGARWMLCWSSSAIVAPVYDGSNQPHHANEDE
jgi:hypothetical protein